MALKIFKFWEKPDTWKRYKGEIFTEEIDYLLDCQHLSGGFSNWPGSTIYLETCYYCLVTLGLCDSVELCSDNIIEYLISHYNIDGGFGDAPGTEASNIFNTFFGIVSLGMLEKLNLIKFDRTIKFLLSKRRDGGFSESKDDPQSLIHTFWIIASLSLLGISDTIEKDKIREFLINCKTKNNLWANYPNSHYGYFEYTIYAIIIDNIMNLNLSFEPELITEILNKHQFNHGFSSYLSTRPNYADTFWGQYMAEAFGLETKIKPYYDKEVMGSWGIFLELISRLNKVKAIMPASKYTQYEISLAGNISDKVYKLFPKIAESNIKLVEFIGFELYKNLSFQTKRDLKTNSDTGVLLNVNSDALNCPWEILFLGKTFLQFNRPIVRANKAQISPRSISLRECLLIYDSNLHSSKLEIEEISDLFNRKGIGTTIISLRDLELNNIDPKYQIIHICGHLQNGIIHCRDVTLRLSKMISEIENMKYEGLLVCNTCNTDESLLISCKACSYTIVNYYGSLSGRTSNDFTKELYNNLLLQIDIGESIRLSKVKLHARSIKNECSYLCFQLWGNPNLYL